MAVRRRTGRLANLTNFMTVSFLQLDSTRRRSTRRALPNILVCALVGTADALHLSQAWAQTASAVQSAGVRDFVQYWSASRLLLDGGNPYSPGELLVLQHSAGWAGELALVMWNPPWTLAFTLPFSLLSFGAAQFAWLFVHLLLILAATQALAKLYGVASDNCRWQWVAALSFVPTVFVLIIGQISPLVFAAMAGFLVLERRRKDFAAGAMLAVVAIKPHLLYLFWPALLLWSFRYRRWQVLLGAAISLLFCALLPLYFDPQVYRHYLELYALEGVITPFHWPAPTLRNIFPLLLGRGDGWLQSLPTLGGLAWLGYYWQRHKAQWQWPEQLPVILLVSVTTSFFAWTYDQVVLLPALIEVAAWLKRSKITWYRSWAVLSYVAVNGLHGTLRFWFAEEFFYFWLAPALTLNYIVYRYEKRCHDASLPSSAD